MADPTSLLRWEVVRHAVARAAGGISLIGVHASSPHGDPHGGGRW
jgi:hypothetical protein